MTRFEVLRTLAAHREEIAGLGVRSLALFGSLARNEATAASDVDLLVDFDRPVGIFALVRLQKRLETILGQDVDLIPRDALKPALREQVEREAIVAT